LRKTSTIAKRIVREWVRVTLFALTVFVLVRTFLLESSFIPTSSMENTLLVGDFLLVNKAVFGAEVPGSWRRLPAIREPRRGDIVVFRPPHDPGRNYVKRLVGVPGDTLEMKDKTLFLNGNPQEESYARILDQRGDAKHPGMSWQSDYLAAAKPSFRYAPSRDNWGPIVVPEARYFVLGDNRDNSEDSRYWGFVPRRDIRGQPWIVYLSVRAPDDRRTGLLGRIRWRRFGRTVP
jgi:signal peptidase I